MRRTLAVLLIVVMVAIPLAACQQAAPTQAPVDVGAPPVDAAPAQEGGTEITRGGTIRLLCPFGVGGTADAIMRQFAQIAGDIHPEFNFIVDNMTGGDGFLATAYFTQLPPDTNTLILLGLGTSYRHELGITYGTEVVDFDRHQILPIATIDDRTWIVYANPGTTLEEIIELGRTGTVRMSGGNPLSDPHLAFGSLIAAEGGSLIVIPYDGGALQRQALINNEVDVFVGTTQAGVEEVQAGLIVPILAISEHAFHGFTTPEGPIVVPTVAGPDRHAALAQDHFGSVIPAGGFIAVRQGASQEWIDMWIEIIQSVWAHPDFYEWKEGIMLNRLELYGPDAVAHWESGILRAMDAFRVLRDS